VEEEEQRRLFFGAEITAPWPKDLPKARLISEEMRHMTLAFIGLNSLAKIQEVLPMAPHPSFKVGPAGIASGLIFLPKDKSRVVALSVSWLDENDPMAIYQKNLTQWLSSQGYSLDQRAFFPHITLGRSPFDKEAWQAQFTPLPFFVQGIHLYQSLGNLQYQSLWQYPCPPPFKELDHTADIAFLVRAESIQQLHSHAQIALAFKDPKLIEFYSREPISSLEEIVISLNEVIARADIAFGCPFKAVSFHGEIKSDEQNILHWEMIVDV
jgi:RNA 2',3'-cyclic 3'-phosphodiesterase